MLAPKYTISTLVIALAVLIGFTVQNPENMALNAANTNTTNTNTNDPKTITTESTQPAESATPELTPSATPIAKGMMVETAISTSSPARTAKPVAKPSATPKAATPSLSPPPDLPSEVESLAVAPAATAAVQENLAPQASPTPAMVIIATATPPINKPAPEQVREGDDPVPGMKKVNLASVEIVKIKEQYEQTAAASDNNEATWKRKADALIVKGMSFLGTPYVFGAKEGQPNSFDCSSFLQYLFATQDVSLPRDAGQQSERGTEVSIDELREGDLVFFTTPKRKNKEGTEQIGHVAVYMGNGLILHTFRQGIGVTVSELDAVWKDRFVKAKRIRS